MKPNYNLSTEVLPRYHNLVELYERIAHVLGAVSQKDIVQSPETADKEVHRVNAAIIEYIAMLIRDNKLSDQLGCLAAEVRNGDHCW